MLNVSGKAADLSKQTPIGKAVQRLLTRDGLTHQQLADLVGVSRLSISKIVRGETKQPKWPLMEELARAFRVSVESLQNGTAGLPGSAARLVQGGVSDGITTLDSGERRPPGLEKWLWNRIGLTRAELWGLEHHRARGIDPAEAEKPEFWDRELEYVRGLIASSQSGEVGGDARGKSADEDGAATRKPRN